MSFSPSDLIRKPDDTNGVATSPERKFLGPYFNELIAGMQQMRAGQFNPDTHSGFSAYYPGEGSAGQFNDSGAFSRNAHQRALSRAQAENEAPTQQQLNNAMGYPIRPYP